MKKSIIVVVLVFFTLSACNTYRRPEAITQACPSGFTCETKTKDEGTSNKLVSFGMMLLMGSLGAAMIIDSKKGNPPKNQY